MKTQLAGRWGEAEAAHYLRKKGYEILESNFHCRFGEIDLIAQRKNTVVFVEVKLRQSSAFALPMENVTRGKQLKIIAAAQVWLSLRESGLQPRFDVIEVYAPGGIGGEGMQINHIENAFSI